jgi:hypothetical protein
MFRGETSRHVTFVLLFSFDHDDLKAARLTPCGTAPRRPSSLVSGLRSEHASPPRPAPAGPGDQARRATNQTCSHAALDVPRSLPWWKEDERCALWKASRGPGASSALLHSAWPSLSIACMRPVCGARSGCTQAAPATYMVCVVRRALGVAAWAAVLGEARGAVRGAPARVEPRRARARPGGRARAATGASRVCGADPKTASDCRAVCGGRHLPGSDTSLTSTSRVSRTVLPDWGPVARTSTDEARRRHARAAAAAAHPSVHFAARLRA